MLDEFNEETENLPPVFEKLLSVLTRMAAFYTEHKEHFATLRRKYENGELDLENRITEGNKWQADMLLELAEQNGLDDVEGFDKLKYLAMIFEQLRVFKKEMYDCQKGILEEQRDAAKRIILNTSKWIENAEVAVAKDPQSKENKKLKKGIKTVKKELAEYEQSLITIEFKLASMEMPNLN